MFELVRQYFGKQARPEGGTIGDSKSEDLRLAAAVVLVAAAGADGKVTSDEKATLLIALERKLGISPEKATSLFESAASGIKSEQTESFLPAIKAHFDREQLQQILALAWSVLAADGGLSRDEAAFAVSLRALLGLSMEEGLRARKLAEDVGVDGFKEVLEGSAAVHEHAQDFVSHKK